MDDLRQNLEYERAAYSMSNAQAPAFARLYFWLVCVSIGGFVANIFMRTGSNSISAENVFRRHVFLIAPYAFSGLLVIGLLRVMLSRPVRRSALMWVALALNTAAVSFFVLVFFRFL